MRRLSVLRGWLTEWGQKFYTPSVRLACLWEKGWVAYGKEQKDARRLYRTKSESFILRSVVNGKSVGLECTFRWSKRWSLHAMLNLSVCSPFHFSTHIYPRGSVYRLYPRSASAEPGNNPVYETRTM